MLQIIQAETAEHIATARELFLEYAQSLGFSLCFQSFDEELASLPGKYGPPKGALLLAFVDGQPAGCVALRPISDDRIEISKGDDDLQRFACEMKRLFVRPGFRGQLVGRKLVDHIIEEARRIGYTHMRLDTVADRMREAVALYRTLGFREIPPYTNNPMPHTLHMELALAPEKKEAATQ